MNCTDFCHMYFFIIIIFYWASFSFVSLHDCPGRRNSHSWSLGRDWSQSRYNCVKDCVGYILSYWSQSSVEMALLRPLHPMLVSAADSEIVFTRWQTSLGADGHSQCTLQHSCCKFLKSTKLETNLIHAIDFTSIELRFSITNLVYIKRGLIFYRRMLDAGLEIRQRSYLVQNWYAGYVIMLRSEYL